MTSNDSDSMRTIVVGFGAYRGGIVRVHNAVCRTLAALGSVHVASAPMEQEKIAGVVVLSQQGPSRALSVLTDLRASRRSQRYDLRVDTAPAFRLRTPARRKVVILHDLNFLYREVHGISRKQLLYRWILHQWTLRYCDLIVCNSTSTRNEAVRFYPGCEKRTIIAPLPIDRLDSRATVRRTEGGPKLLSFGHAANKNVEPLLKYLSRTPGAALTVICTSPEWDKFWGETAKSLGVSQRVNRLDSLTDAELAAQYENCDVFCMLSTYEGYGLPVAEALSLGRPTVISQNETLMETSRGYALQVDPEDDESLDETIRKAMSIQTDYWQNAKSSFTGPSWEEWIAEILKCLDALEPLEHSYGNGQ